MSHLLYASIVPFLFSYKNNVSKKYIKNPAFWVELGSKLMIFILKFLVIPKTEEMDISFLSDNNPLVTWADLICTNGRLILIQFIDLCGFIHSCFLPGVYFYKQSPYLLWFLGIFSSYLLLMLHRLVFLCRSTMQQLTYNDLLIFL